VYDLRERPLNCILARGVRCLAGKGKTVVTMGRCNVEA
jgi:hypothetical protein